MKPTTLAVASLILSLSPAVARAGNAGDLLDEVQVGGFAQIDYTRRQISVDELSDGTREPLNEDRFQVRRARLRLWREWKYVGVFSVTEFFADGSTVRPIGLDIHAQLPAKEGADEDAPPRLIVRAGLQPVPFGLENYEQTDDIRFFGERALFTAGFIPGRFDLGVSVGGHLWGAVDWIVAVQNGEPIGSGPYPYLDPNGGKDISGRIRVEGEIVEGVHIAFASSVLSGRGFSPGTAPTKDTFEWRDLNEDGRVLQSELLPIPGSAGRPSQDFRRWGVGSDLQLWTEVPRLGHLHVYTEVGLGVNLDRGVAPADPVLLGRDQRSLGILVAFTQDFTKHVTLGARAEQYEPSVDALELFDGVTVLTRQRFRTLTTGLSLNHFPREDVRVRLHTEVEVQQNSLGRDNQGRPAQLDNGTFRVRAEVRF